MVWCDFQTSKLELHFLTTSKHLWIFFLAFVLVGLIGLRCEPNLCTIELWQHVCIVFAQMHCIYNPWFRAYVYIHFNAFYFLKFCSFLTPAPFVMHANENPLKMYRKKSQTQWSNTMFRFSYSNCLRTVETQFVFNFQLTVTADRSVS